MLRTIKKYDIAELNCSAIRSHHIVSFVRSLGVLPQTRASYASHLSAVFTVAKPLWGYPLDTTEMESAMIAMRKLGIIAKGDSRDRRPTLEELDVLMNHFARIKANRDQSDCEPEILNHNAQGARAYRRRLIIRNAEQRLRCRRGLS